MSNNYHSTVMVNYNKSLLSSNCDPPPAYESTNPESVNAGGPPPSYSSIQYVSARQSNSPAMLDSSLKHTLRQITLNQLSFFEALYQFHSKLLDTLNYGRTELIEWKGIIEDYEDYMYKLAETPTIRVRMSIEMELVWRVHMLNPTVYYYDCMRRFGRLIEHNSANPNVRYFRHNHTDFIRELGGKPTPHRAFIGNTLIMTDAILRQLKFVARIVNINHKKRIDQSQLNAAVERYDRFMQCMFDPNKPSSCIMVPTLDIDLIWHSHQLDPGHYYDFCVSRSPTNQLVSHDDNIPENVLNTERINTAIFWNVKFGAGDYNGSQAFFESVVVQSNANNAGTEAQQTCDCPIDACVSAQLMLLVIVTASVIVIGYTVGAPWGTTIPLASVVFVLGMVLICCCNGCCGGSGGGSSGGGVAWCGGGGCGGGCGECGG